MPSRGFYQINSAEQGETAQTQQFYKSCVLSILIFCFLCIILLLVSLPWKMFLSYDSEQEDEYAGTVERYHHGYHNEHQPERTSTTKSIGPYLSTTISVNEDSSNELETTRSNLEVIAENSNTSKLEEILVIENVTESVSVIAITDNEIIIDEQQYNSTIKVDPAENDTSRSITEEYTERNTTVESATETTSTTETISTTETTSTTEATSTTETISTTEATSTTESNQVSNEFSMDYYDYSSESTVPDTTKFTTENEAEMIKRFITTVTYESMSTASTPSINKHVCTTGECKNVASRMLFYMDHTIDPCEDFYEYACGGFETNPHTKEWSLEDMAYQRIFNEMQKQSEENTSSLFIQYYNSCMRYEAINRTQRIKLARQILDKVDQFYTTIEWNKDHTSFTELLANLLLHNSAILFDVAPDLDEYSPNRFTLKIGPTTFDNPFETDQADDPCYASQSKGEHDETVDLGKLYAEYKDCKNDTEKFIESISEALTTLGVFDKLENPYNISQYIHSTYINIDMEIVQQFFANFPSKNKIREAYLMKNYTRVTIEKLQTDFNIVNWTQLIELLTKEKIKPETMVQVYFYDALAKGLTSLDRFRERSPMDLHNALLGLYTRNLYHELVVAKHLDAKKHCLRVAANVLIPEASNLYMSSFSEEQLTYMNDTIHSLFEKLKKTLKLRIEQLNCAKEEGRHALIEKIDGLKVVVPDISYITDPNSTYKKNYADMVNLTDNYLENSIVLMQRYRKLIYAELFTNPGHLEQIWTHYATPYQSNGVAIYGLNLVVIPFGVIDWSMKYNNFSFDYIKLATLGNVIAHEIAHHFDANGIYYWNGTRDAENILLNDDDFINTNLMEYIHNQQSVLYQNRMKMTLSSTGQNVFYEISQLTLNERLSEITGLMLAYDTLAQLRSEEDYLPWLELDFKQLFYLTYAQMHCTKSPLTSSYIPLYEKEQLPSRIRIFVSASNIKLLGEAWDCPEGSQIMPSYVSPAFPYFQC